MQWKRMYIAVILIAGSMVSAATPADAITCQSVRKLIGHYLKMHFYHHSFDDELSRRTLDNFIKAWDPGKVYFLKADVDKLKASYSTTLNDQVLAGKCGAIDAVLNAYSKRFAERQVVVTKFINTKHDFTVDEYMAIDRKKIEWATTTEEINERWRKRIKFQVMQMNETLDDLKKTQEKLTKRYALTTKRHNDMTSDDVYSMFLNAFSASLDPHSEYLSPESLEDFRISTRLSLEGIGAVLRSEDGFTTIQSLVPGGAAFKTGRVKVDDKIVGVAQGTEPPVDVIDMDLREVVKLIRGTRGTEVRLTIVRDEGGKNRQLVVPIIREKIQLEDRAAKSYVYDVNIKDAKTKKDRLMKVGVIDLPSFYMDFEGRQNRRQNFRSSSADMLREIGNLKKKGVEALVVDLRSNGGGALDESVNIAGLFIDKGPVVQTKGPKGSTFVNQDEDPNIYYDGPLVVMINRQSASASEILAGAIQDYGRGLVVGDTHTFGKGTVQNLNEMDDRLGAIKVTIAKFYRPSGGSTQLRGVASDIVLPDILDEYEMGEKYYDYALPWEKIKPTKFSKLNLVKPYVESLKTASTARVKKSEGFKEVFEAIKEYRENEDDRTRVSLKAEKAKEEKKAAKEEEEAEEITKEMREDPVWRLKNDPMLQETLQITADYVTLLGKKKLGPTSLPQLDAALLADQKKEKSMGTADNKQPVPVKSQP